jgi:hypothetical protein
LSLKYSEFTEPAPFLFKYMQLGRWGWTKWSQMFSFIFLNHVFPNHFHDLSFFVFFNVLLLYISCMRGIHSVISTPCTFNKFTPLLCSLTPLILSFSNSIY